MRTLNFCFLLLLVGASACAQSPKLSIYDGIIVLGVVDRGAYLNFTGPNLHATYGHSKLMIGMLPSLRYKRDTNTPKNPLITPTLGLGFTYTYKALALQLPLYFNPKTTTQDGHWQLGLGVGLYLNGLKKE